MSIRYYRTVVNPGIVEAYEQADQPLDEASALKKFGATMRAISILLGSPGMPAEQPPAPAVTVPVQAPEAFATKEKTVALKDPPKKKSGSKKLNTLPG